MSDPIHNLDTAEQAAPAGDGVAVVAATRVLRMFGALRTWAYGHRLRSLIVAGVILSLIAFTMAGWAYLAKVALHTGQLSVDEAFAAIENDRREEARAGVASMLNSGLLPRSEYGGPLLVLGAIKIKDAESEPSAHRRRIEYLVAARYLKEARAYGIPPHREADGLFMLGKSLVESGQFEEGLLVLEELLEDPAEHNDQTRRAARLYLANACLLMPTAKIDTALELYTTLLEDSALAEDQRAVALLQRAECLARLQRFDEARQSISAVDPAAAPLAEVELCRGKLLLDEVDAALQEATADRRQAVVDESASKLAQAMQHLAKAAVQDARKSHVARQAAYYIGRAYELQGDDAAALKQHARTRQLHEESPAGMASALAEADLLRRNRNFNAALLGYRRVLDAYESAPIYRSQVVPLAELRERMMAALKDYVGRERFEEALDLIGRFPPLFSRAEQLELRGGTLERWGQLLIGQATNDDAAQPDKQRTDGLRKLRAAGLAYEQLAEARFATRSYTADLWRSAENYFAGHSFTSAIRLLQEYLNHEPDLRNAQALLRLGQAHLAVRQIPQSIAAFEECIEFHPLDSATFQARIDCAKAWWQQGDTDRAERLLRDNIVGSTLKPSSREWKDSLFELGMLQHEKGDYQRAIVTLEEAIERYPQDSQRLVAQYVVGESYRRWGQELLTRAREARTASERDKNRQQADEHLATALSHFEEVQVSITLKSHDLLGDRLYGTMLRNCYMLEGTVLFDLGRFKEAIESYSNVASLYPDNPFVLETFVQIANCWRRLGQNSKARGAIQQAQIVLQGLPPDADFASATALSRDEWGMLLADMSKW